jgi:hypothetical protein
VFAPYEKDTPKNPNKTTPNPTIIALFITASFPVASLLTLLFKKVSQGLPQSFFLSRKLMVGASN